MKTVVIVLVVLLAVLQFRLWVGSGSLAEVWSQRQELQAQHDENDRLSMRNRRLHAEVVDLKKGVEVVEDRARRDLGLIGKDETFFQIVEK